MAQRATGSNQYQTRPGHPLPDSPAGGLLAQTQAGEDLAQQIRTQAQREMYQRLADAPRDTTLWAANQPDCPDDIRTQIYELALTNGGGYGAQSLLDSHQAMRYISDPTAAAAILRWSNQGFIDNPVSRLMQLPDCGPDMIAKAIEKWPAQADTLLQHPGCSVSTAQRAQKIASSSRGQWETWVARQPKPGRYDRSTPGQPNYTYDSWGKADEQQRDELARIAPPSHLQGLLIEMTSTETWPGRQPKYNVAIRIAWRKEPDRSLLPTPHQIDIMWSRPSPRTPTALKSEIIRTQQRVGMAVTTSCWEDINNMKDGRDVWLAAANHPGCPPATLEQILRRTAHPTTREAALNNPALPAATRAMWQLSH